MRSAVIEIAPSSKKNKQNQHKTDASFFVRRAVTSAHIQAVWNLVAGVDAEGGDLAAAAGDVGETGGAEAGEESGEAAAEKIGGEVDEHVFEVDWGACGAGLHDVRENFAADWDAFLDDPAAGVAACVCSGQGLFDRGVPGFFVGFPAERDAGATVFVAGLEDEILALFAGEGEKLDCVAIMLRARVGDDACPRNVTANELLLI